MTTTTPRAALTIPAPALPAHPPAAPARSPRSGLLIGLLLATQFMALVDVSIVNVAVPTLQRHLHASGAGLQLVVAGYTLTYAMLLVTGARLGDIAGHRRMFTIGTALFTVSSLACGLAPTTPALVVARLVQGAGAALAIPQVLSVIQRQLEGAARMRALSAYAAVLASGLVVGQVLGGLIVSWNISGQTWRPVFLVNVPIGIAVVALVPRIVPADRPSASRQLDITGLIVAATAVCAIVLPLILGREEGWPAWTFVTIAVGVVLGAVFVPMERSIKRRGGDPILDVDVLRARGLGPAMLALSTGMIAYAGFSFGLTLHLQEGLGDSALRAGLTFAPAAVLFGAIGYWWRKLPVRSHHLLVPTGFAAAAGAYLLFALVVRGGHQGAPLLAVLAIAGLTNGLGFSPLIAQALTHVPLQRAADASGVLTTVLQLSQVVGVAVFGTVFLDLAGDHGAHATAHAIASVTTAGAVLLAIGAVIATRLARAARTATQE